MYNQFEHFVWEYLFAEIVDNFSHGEQLSYSTVVQAHG